MNHAMVLSIYLHKILEPLCKFTFAKAPNNVPSHVYASLSHIYTFTLEVRFVIS